MKVRCVNELQTMQLRHLTVRNEFLVKMEHGLAQAAASQNLVIGISVACAAQGLHAMADGLIQNWLLDIMAFDLIGSGQKVIDVDRRPTGGLDARPVGGRVGEHFFEQA